MKKISVGLIGFGNVGSGVVKILQTRKNLLAQKIGSEIFIKKICDKDFTRKRNVQVDKGMLTHNPNDILDDPGIDIVVELVGGIHPAKEIIIQALQKGKHVVSANKALLAQAGIELFTIARDRGKNIYFEASVAAGIPIIKSIREGLVANRFNGIFGIVNGTSNFILSEMSQKGCTFQEALQQARQKGYAERDASLDIEGIDSAHKLVILAYLCFGRWVSMKDVFVEGISLIRAADIAYARELGFEIKLLAISKKNPDGLDVRVHPTLVSSRHLLASVGGVFNAIYVSADMAGDLLFYGPGAGQFCAASAVVADLVDLSRDIKAGLFKSTSNIVMDDSVVALCKIDDIESRYYIRLMTADKPGVLAKISGILAKFNISIASVSQKDKGKSSVVPIVMITHGAKEKFLRGALSLIARLDVVKEPPVAIRIEEL